jgi:hypothetical protein
MTTRNAKPLPNARKPLNAEGWIDGTALPYWREQTAAFEARWGRKLHPLAAVLAHDCILVAIDPSLLLLAVNRLTGTPTKAARAARGITDRRAMLGRVDDQGNDTRECPASLAPAFAACLSHEPDFVLSIMPGLRALWLKGTTAAQWENPSRRDFARDLRAPEGETATGILLGVLDDDTEGEGRADTIDAAKTVAPSVNFTPGLVDKARNLHRQKKPYTKPVKRKAKE